MTWTLIMTIILTSSATHIGVVDGFTTESSCIAAANLWQKHATQKSVDTVNYISTNFAICVQK